jgi:hypothetical protein
MPTNSCPSGAPPGSKWTIVGGKFQCKAPDGSIIPSGSTAAPTINPTAPGRPGGVPGAPMGGGASSPYTTLPGSPAPSIGGGSRVPGGGGGGNIPWWLSGGIGLIGSIIKGKGRDKERKQEMAEAMRLEAEDRAAAEGKMAMMKGILKANGWGDLISDDKLLAMIMKTSKRPNTAGGLLQDIGGGLQGIGGGLLLDTYGDPATGRITRTRRGEQPATAASQGSSLAPPATSGSASVDPTASKDFQDFLDELLKNPLQRPGAQGMFS